MRIGAVVIGRNEQRYLSECLASLGGQFGPIVYVDSASTDRSAAIAQAAEVEIVQLSNDRQLTAALARNAGFARLCEIAPDVELVQFLDGDCVLDWQWLAKAVPQFASDEKLAAVAGGRSERFARASLYNLICELEWREADHLQGDFGGDVLLRTAAYRAAGGYNPQMIACEDHDLACRLHRLGWRISRVDAPMTLHDSHITHLSQWYRRCVRRGVGYAQTHRHQRPGEVAAIARIVLWTAVFPLIILLLAWRSRGWSLLFLLVYFLRGVRIIWLRRRRGATYSDATLWAAHCLLSPFGYLSGMLQYAGCRLMRRQPRLVEYHAPPTATPRE